MKEINLIQGSVEWKEFRRTHITSTDAAVICEVNPYKTPFELYIEKMDGLETPVNERMRRGSQLEEPARQLLIEHTGIDFMPSVVVHDTKHWAMASLDGLSNCSQFICEIKAPSRDTHELAISGEVKSYYLCQMQHALFVSGALSCFYCSYLPGHKQEICIIEISPDKQFIKEMIEKEKAFYKCMCEMRAPDKPWQFNIREPF